MGSFTLLFVLLLFLSSSSLTQLFAQSCGLQDIAWPSSSCTITGSATFISNSSSSVTSTGNAYEITSTNSGSKCSGNCFISFNLTPPSSASSGSNSIGFYLSLGVNARVFWSKNAGLMDLFFDNEIGTATDTYQMTGVALNALVTLTLTSNSIFSLYVNNALLFTSISGGFSAASTPLAIDITLDSVSTGASVYNIKYGSDVCGFDSTGHPITTAPATTTTTTLTPSTTTAPATTATVTTTTVAPTTTVSTSTATTAAVTTTTDSTTTTTAAATTSLATTAASTGVASKSDWQNVSDSLGGDAATYSIFVTLGVILIAGFIYLGIKARTGGLPHFSLNETSKLLAK